MVEGAELERAHASVRLLELGDDERTGRGVPANPAQDAVGDLGSAPKIDDDDIGTASDCRAGDGLGRLGSVRREAGHLHGVHEELNVIDDGCDDEHIHVSGHGQHRRRVSGQRQGPHGRIVRRRRSGTVAALERVHGDLLGTVRHVQRRAGRAAFRPADRHDSTESDRRALAGPICPQLPASSLTCCAAASCLLADVRASFGAARLHLVDCLTSMLFCLGSDVLSGLLSAVPRLLELRLRLLDNALFGARRRGEASPAAPPRRRR